jgi:hypothetical protein
LVNKKPIYNLKMIKKHILTGLFLIMSSILSAQVMLPAYQGLFSKKSATTVSSPTTNSIKITGATLDNLSFPKSASLNATGNYTFETWIKFNTIGAGQMDPIFGGGQNDYLSIYGSFATRINVNNPCSGDRNLFSSSLLTTTNWHHIAVVRSGSTVTAFLDGIARGSTDCTGTFLYSLSTILIGKNTWRTGNLDAYITNMRYVVGTAVYTSNYTPPTTLLTAITGTQFLLLVNNSATPYKDSSANNVTITTSGSPTFTPNFGPF